MLPIRPVAQGVVPRAEKPEFVWGLIASMYTGNIIGVIMVLAFVPVFAAILRMPFAILTPFITVICAIGAYAVHNNMGYGMVKNKSGKFVDPSLESVTAAAAANAANIPADLRLMMEILPSRQNSRTYWLLYRRDAGTEAPMTLQIDLDACPRCDERLQTVDETPGDEQIVPHVQIEVYWEGNVASFPVRFDEKDSLPLLLLGRKPTEGELIDYFLFGREPGDGGNGGTDTDNGTEAIVVNTVDTRRILCYFIRRFVQAIPGIETEIARAAYNQRSLHSALRGPTSPLELAERAFASLSKPASPDEPSKTPTAVAFQLVEIGAALLRSRSKVQDPELRWCFDPVIARCKELLERLTGKYQELQQETFRLYKRLLLEES